MPPKKTTICFKRASTTWIQMFTAARQEGMVHISTSAKEQLSALRFLPLVLGSRVSRGLGLFGLTWAFLAGLTTGIFSNSIRLRLIHHLFDCIWILGIGSNWGNSVINLVTSAGCEGHLLVLLNPNIPAVSEQTCKRDGQHCAHCVLKIHNLRGCLCCKPGLEVQKYRHRHRLKLHL